MRFGVITRSDTGGEVRGPTSSEIAGVSFRIVEGSSLVLRPLDSAHFRQERFLLQLQHLAGLQRSKAPNP